VGVLCVGEQDAELWFWENAVWRRKTAKRRRKKFVGKWDNSILFSRSKTTQVVGLILAVQQEEKKGSPSADDPTT
jgi:hypothetical protein